MDPKSGYSGLRKISFESSNLTKFFPFQNFSTVILKNNVKSKKACPGLSFLLLNLEKIIYLCFLCHAKKTVIVLYLISLSLHVTFIEILRTFLSSGYVSGHVQNFKGFEWNLLKSELFKNKTLVRISFLRHIHHACRN